MHGEKKQNEFIFQFSLNHDRMFSCTSNSFVSKSIRMSMSQTDSIAFCLTLCKRNYRSYDFVYINWSFASS